MKLSSNAFLVGVAIWQVGRAQNTSTDFFFSPGSPGATGDYSNNQVWAIGSNQTITWNTDFTSLTLLLWQDALYSDSSGTYGINMDLFAPGASALYYNGQLDWTVSLSSQFDQSKSSAYYFAMYNGSFINEPTFNGSLFTSHYFNITSASSSSIMSSTTSTVISSSTSTSITSATFTTPAAVVTTATGIQSQPPLLATPTVVSAPDSSGLDNSQKVGVGVGVGIGVPILALLGLAIFLLMRRRKPTEAQHFPEGTLAEPKNADKFEDHRPIGVPHNVNLAHELGDPRGLGNSHELFDSRGNAAELSSYR